MNYYFKSILITRIHLNALQPKTVNFDSVVCLVSTNLFGHGADQRISSDSCVK